MEHKIKLPLPLLRAACLAAADDNFLQPQIESVVIDKGYMVAIDGAIMFWAKLDNVNPDLHIVIPRINVECFIKKTEGFKNFICDLIYNPETSQGYFEIPHCVACHESFKTFFDKGYTNWQKIIPVIAKDVVGFPHFQTKYHAMLSDIAIELGSICRPKITPNGERGIASIEFLLSEFDDVHACIAPLDMSFSQAKYCVEINDEPDTEPEQMPAASAEIALRAAQRLRKDYQDGLGISVAKYIQPAVWQGSNEDHQEKMLYTEDWFNQPLRQYNNAAKAINYLNKRPGEVVRCFVGDILGNTEIHARTTQEVEKFFAENSDFIADQEQGHD